MEVIKVSQLKKEYKDLTAVNKISFEVHKGEIFGILGPNGAGKTTTLEIIEGLKRQTSGTCLVLGFDNLKDPKEIKKRIGVQLQSSEYLNYLTASELLVLFGSLYKQKIDPIVVLKKVNLEEKANSTIKELSGGQKQRFTIASALVHDPEILFLDEPTTGLDPQARRNLWQLVKELNAQGITIILTTHYMEEAEYLCGRVAVMDKGQILKIGSPAELINEVAKGYEVSFFTDKPITENLFSGISGIKKYVQEFPKTVMGITDAEDLPKIITKLKGAGINYSFLNMKTATLEDVYLQLTGHEYQI